MASMVNPLMGALPGEGDLDRQNERVTCRKLWKTGCEETARSWVDPDPGDDSWGTTSRLLVWVRSVL